MAGNDFFVDEVSEDLRRDRFYGWLKRAKWLIGAIVLGVIGFVGINEFRASQGKKEGEALFGALLAARDAAPGEEAAAIEALEGFSGRELADWALGVLYSRGGKSELAREKFAAIAQNSSYSDALKTRALIELFALDKEAALERTDPGFLGSSAILEAENALGAGDKEGAIVALERALDEAAPNLRPLIERMIISLGGDIPEEGETSSANTPEDVGAGAEPKSEENGGAATGDAAPEE